MGIVHSEFVDYFNYDIETGLFYSPVSRQGVKYGRPIGTILPSGYRQMHYKGKLYKAHRLVWFYVTGEWPDGLIDHINQDRSDDRFSNLRLVTPSENSRNRRLPSHNKSGVIGVSLGKDNKWHSQITLCGRQLRLYSGYDFFEAVCARKCAALAAGYHKNHGS